MMLINLPGINLFPFQIKYNNIGIKSNRITKKERTITNIRNKQVNKNKYFKQTS